MSALLSPTKPVRTRFKVPGEGAYELQMDLAPPVGRPSVSATPTTSSSGTNSSSAGKPAPSHASGSPLGLPRVTKLSFAADATVQSDATTTPPPARPPSPGGAAATAASLFSLRKLTALGLGKLSAGAGDEETATTATATGSVGVGTGTGGSGVPARDRDSVGPRAPPRVATSDGPRRDGVAAATTGASGSSGNLGMSTSTTSNASGVLAYNTNDIIVLLDVATRTTSELPLAGIARAAASCHALVTRDGLRLIVGCTNGEVLYFSDLVASIVAATARRNRAAAEAGASASASSQATVSTTPSNPVVNAPPPVMYNKDGALNSARVVALRWLPGPSSLLRFAALHSDGAVIIHDAKQRPATASSLRGTATPAAASVQADDMGKFEAGDGGSGAERTVMGSGVPTHRRTGSASAATAVAAAAANGLGPHDVLITRQAKGKRGSAATMWQIGRSAATACDFSPVWGGESNVLAIAGRDGYLRVVDVGREAAVAAFRSYFGALLCVAWSPDGRYVAAGGEDDLISIWCVADEHLVARLEGHTSWVSAVAWDAALCGAGRYRLGSAGQDAKLLLWDFALDALHRRTSLRSTTSSNVVQLRAYRREVGGGGGVGANGIGSGAASWKGGKLGRLRGVANLTADSASDGSAASSAAEGHAATACAMPVVVPAPGRADVPIVEPVVAHVAHGEPLTDIWFGERGVFTADAVGSVKLWLRPPQHSVPELSLGKGRASGGTTEGLSSLLGTPSDLD